MAAAPQPRALKKPQPPGQRELLARTFIQRELTPSPGRLRIGVSLDREEGVAGSRVMRDFEVDFARSLGGVRADDRRNCGRSMSPGPARERERRICGGAGPSNYEFVVCHGRVVASVRVPQVCRAEGRCVPHFCAEWGRASLRGYPSRSMSRRDRGRARSGSSQAA